jgi:hypothetical protein
MLNTVELKVEVPESSLSFFNGLGWGEKDFSKSLRRDLMAEADRIGGDVVEQKRLLEEALK